MPRPLRKMKTSAPEDATKNPSFIGTILEEPEKGKIKLRTLSTLGISAVVWIDSKDIVSKTNYDDKITKIDVKQGSEILVETVRKIPVGNPSIPKETPAKNAPILPGPFSPLAVDLLQLSEIKTSSKENSNCGHCDWRYVTHCSGCSDQNSSKTCVRPFVAYYP